MAEPRVPKPSMVGHYAGPVTRLGAYVADIAIATALFTLGSAGLVWLAQFVLGQNFDVSDISSWISAPLFVLWYFLYFWVPWSISGQTPGMALAGVEVVRRDGSDLRPGHAALRVLALPLSFFFFGLGFAGIVLGREHRALHDVIAGTVVVYAWDARAVRMRFLAANRRRQKSGAEVPAGR